MENLKILTTPITKTFTICLIDGSKITIAASSYFISDDGTYAFSSFTDEELARRFWKGAIVTPLFEIPKKLVAMIFENSDRIQFHLCKKPKPILKKIKPKQIKKRKQRKQL